MFRHCLNIAGITCCIPLFLWTSTITAVENDGETLMQQCGQALLARQQPDTVSRHDIQMCIGRLSGIMRLQTYYCIPDGTPLDEVISTVHGWLVNHPQRLGENAGALSIEALAESWPCNP